MMISCLLCTILGYHFLYQIRISEAKKEMKELLRSGRYGKSIRLSLTAEEVSALEWESESELRYEGTMYDVLAQQWKEGKLLISCLRDEEETMLVRDYMMARQNAPGKPVVSLFQLISTPFVSTGILLPTIPEKEFTKRFITHPDVFPTTILTVLSPPPDFI